MKHSHSKGFTLAEVLVTLGIIGVVSAMTIPTLVKNHQRTVYVTQLKKVVTELAQAADRAASDNNAVSLDETKYRREGGAADFLKDYFKIARDCGESATPCFADSYETMSGDSAVFPETVDDAVTLASGASILIWSNDLGYDPEYHGYLDIIVDVNGRQGPNIYGRDLFQMQLYSDGKIAETYNGSDPSDNCLTSDYGVGCFTKVVNNGWTMDY